MPCLCGENPQQFSHGSVVALSFLQFQNLPAIGLADLEPADADTFPGCVIDNVVRSGWFRHLVLILNRLTD